MLTSNLETEVEKIKQEFEAKGISRKAPDGGKKGIHQLVAREVAKATPKKRMLQEKKQKQKPQEIAMQRTWWEGPSWFGRPSSAIVRSEFELVRPPCRDFFSVRHNGWRVSTFVKAT